MIYITGDLHGEIDIDKLDEEIWLEGNNLTKDDYLIICGDFGLIWDIEESGKIEQYWIDWLSNKPWTTLFLDGNHENFDRLLKLPSKQLFGAEVGIVSDSIFHLKRGQIYTIDGQKIFVLGGGYSRDAHLRKEGVDWWSQELPTEQELDDFIITAEIVKEVDYIISHVPPLKVAPAVYSLGNVPLFYEMRLSYIYNIMKFKQWYFGHLHIDEQMTYKATGLFDKIIKIGETVEGKFKW